MKDHGEILQKLYDTMPQEPEKIYPYISLPASAFEAGEYQPGHECQLLIKVRIDSMNENTYECKLLGSQEVEEENEKEE